MSHEQSWVQCNTDLSEMLDMDNRAHQQERLILYRNVQDIKQFYQMFNM